MEMRKNFKKDFYLFFPSLWSLFENVNTFGDGDRVDGLTDEGPVRVVHHAEPGLPRSLH